MTIDLVAIVEQFFELGEVDFAGVANCMGCRATQHGAPFCFLIEKWFEYFRRRFTDIFKRGFSGSHDTRVRIGRAHRKSRQHGYGRVKRLGAVCQLVNGFDLAPALMILRDRNQFVGRRVQKALRKNWLGGG